MLAGLQVVVGVGLQLFSLGSALVASVAIGVKGEVLLRKIDLGNDLFVFVGGIVVGLHNGVIARSTDVLLGFAILIFLIVDQRFAGPSFVNGECRGIAARRIAVDGHADVLFGSGILQRIALHTFAGSEDDGDPRTLMFQEQRDALIVIGLQQFSGGSHPRSVHGAPLFIGTIVQRIDIVHRLGTLRLGVIQQRHKGISV